MWEFELPYSLFIDPSVAAQYEWKPPAVWFNPLAVVNGIVKLGSLYSCVIYLKCHSLAYTSVAIGCVFCAVVLLACPFEMK